MNTPNSIAATGSTTYDKAAVDAAFSSVSALLPTLPEAPADFLPPPSPNPDENGGKQALADIEAIVESGPGQHTADQWQGAKDAIDYLIRFAATP